MNSNRYIFTFERKTIQISSTDFTNNLGLFNTLSQYFQYFVRIKDQSEYKKDSIIFTKGTKIELEKSLPMIECEDKIYLFSNFNELKKFYEEKNLFVNSIMFNEREFTSPDEISEYAKANYLFDYRLTIVTSKIINMEFKIDGKTELVKITEGVPKDEQILKQYYNNRSFISLLIEDDNTVNARINIHGKNNKSYKEKLKNRETTIKEFLDGIKNQYELKDIELETKQSPKSKIIDIETNEDYLTIKNFELIKLKIGDKKQKISLSNTIGTVLENIFPGDSEYKYFMTSGKFISDKNQLAFKFHEKKLNIFDFKKNSITIEINCKYFALDPIRIDNKNFELLESSKNIIKEIIDRSKINRNPSYLEIRYNDKPLTNILITNKMKDGEGNVVIPLDVIIKKALFILKVNDDESSTYREEFINEEISTLSKEYECDKVKLYDIDNRLIDSNKNFLYLAPEKEYTVEMLDIHSFILPKSKKSKENTLQLELPRYDTFEHALSLQDETKDIPYLVFNDKRNITKDKITEKNKKDKPLNLKINYKFIDAKTNRSQYKETDKLSSNVLKFIADNLLSVKVERVEAYFITNDEQKKVKEDDTLDDFDYKNGCAFNYRLLPPILKFEFNSSDIKDEENRSLLERKEMEYKEQLENKDKEYKSLLEKKEMEYKELIESKDKEHKSLLESKEMEYKEQLEVKNKEIEKLRQKNKNLEKEIQNDKQNPSKSIKNPKEIQMLDSQDIKKYEIEEEIGSGASGKVLKVFMKQYYALKIMKTEDATIENLQHFIGEYEIMNLLNHPNILKAFGIFFSDENTPPSILLEYCPYNLKKAIKDKSLSPVQLVCAIYQIAEGMRYIHFRKVIHRDLKPLNILIAEDGTIKISDFGISKLMTPEEFSMTIGIGSNKFMAPEILAEEDDYNEKVDVYSFGVLMFYMITGGELPKIKTPQILRGMKAEIPSNFTQFAKELINLCWNFDPNDRPSFDEICKLLNENNYHLLNLAESEKVKVREFVNNHQKRIPHYSE